MLVGSSPIAISPVIGWVAPALYNGCGAAVVRDGRILLLRRLRPPEAGTWSLPGGKIDAGEPWQAAVHREVTEELGIHLTDARLLCVVNLMDEGQHWVSPVLLATAFEGEPYLENPEGPLEWVPMSRLGALPMWEGDRFFLPLVFDGDPRPFHGVMPYNDGRPVSWQFTRM